MLLLTDAISGYKTYQLAAGHPNTTVATYGYLLAHLCRKLDNPTLASVTTADLRLFLGGLRGQYKPNSIVAYWCTFRAFFRWAASELDVDNPAASIPAPKAEGTEAISLTQDDIKALLKACTYTRTANTKGRRAFAMRRATGNRDTALVLVLLDTGLRASEVCRLRVQEVDLESGYR